MPEPVAKWPDVPLMSRPAVYRIRVPGRLDPSWSECLQGMAVATVEADGHATVTELSGELADQAALMGVLEQLYNCGIAVISVECLGASTAGQ